MKAFLGLGVLCLLACLIWADQQEPVTVQCTLLMFRVLVKKNLFGSGSLVRAEELTLGSGCRVTQELPDKFELFYSVTECGIHSQVTETHVIYSTNLRYVALYPGFGPRSRDFPVSCKVSKGLQFSDSEEDDTFLPQSKRRGTVKMWASVGPSRRTPELQEMLKKQNKEGLLIQQNESCAASSSTLTQSSPVCHLFHGDTGLAS
ncbi:oocyte-secreted protein 3-like isoform X2 [Antechinus flavipes]|uniref:oocyte-secreted protein 3-like isoform X2 n=1 Tax=Antechinus flavipes TaxID=38775 RepID=UPI002236B116|nr:oocyte-secreted protein 3-like isoform X2 [Antechinus flavipes]